MDKPWKIGCIGAGGQALKLMRLFVDTVPPERAVLAAVRPSGPEEAAANPVIQSHGIRCVDTVGELLNHCELDAVLIPTSIHSHLDYTRQALEAGLHVLVEKPVAATIDEVDAMIELRDRHRLTVAVGYQGTYTPSTQWVKETILGGGIGKVLRARLTGLWPRRDSYYNRNDWAGKLRAGDQWVLDSPANNALAHQINFALYFTGKDRHASNQPVAVEAELYRARPGIDNFDTGAIRCETEAGCPLLILLSHACAEADGPVVEIIGESGIIRRRDNACELERDGTIVEKREDDAIPERFMYENFLDKLEGKTNNVLCALENGRAQTLVINGAAAACPVRPVPETHVRRVVPEGAPEGDGVFAIEGLPALFAEAFSSFRLPSETGMAEWTRPPGRLDLSDFTRFPGVPEPAG